MTVVNFVDVKLFDIVQIKPETDPVFGSCMLTVLKVKAWGVQGYVSVPTSEGVREAYYRCKHTDYVNTGGSTPYIPDVFTPDDDDDVVDGSDNIVKINGPNNDNNNIR